MCVLVILQHRGPSTNHDHSETLQLTLTVNYSEKQSCIPHHVQGGDSTDLKLYADDKNFPFITKIFSISFIVNLFPRRTGRMTGRYHDTTSPSSTVWPKKTRYQPTHGSVQLIHPKEFMFKTEAKLKHEVTDRNIFPPVLPILLISCQDESDAQDDESLSMSRPHCPSFNPPEVSLNHLPCDRGDRNEMFNPKPESLLYRPRMDGVTDGELGHMMQQQSVEDQRVCGGL